MVEGFTDFVEFFVLLSVVSNLSLLRKAFLGELAYLHLVVHRVQKLTFLLLELDPEHLDLGGEPLNLNGLENYDELGALTQVLLLGASREISNLGAT